MSLRTERGYDALELRAGDLTQLTSRECSHTIAETGRASDEASARELFMAGFIDTLQKKWGEHHAKMSSRR